MAVVVEFVGTAGVGKTYAVNELESTFGQSAFTAIENRKTHTWDNVRFALSHPQVVVATVLLLVVSRAKLRHVGRLFMNTLSVQMRLAMARRSHAEFAVLSAGFFQRVRAVRKHSRRSNLGYSDIPRFIAARFFYPDIVILLDADAETVVERRFARRAVRNSRRQFDDREAELRHLRWKAPSMSDLTLRDLAAAQERWPLVFRKYQNDTETDVGRLAEAIRKIAPVDDRGARTRGPLK
jgi:thymidylate kinase